MTAPVLTPAKNSDIQSCTTRAPAKINLTLEVLGKRPDGFHEIRSLVVGVGLYDELYCSRANGDIASIDCSDPFLSTPENLAVRAAGRLAQAAGSAASVHIKLQKGIPVASGFGGGSSDAAACLRACNRLWDARLSVATLAKLGAELGSDVPLFFHLPSALMTGRGEIVRAMTMCWRGLALLVMPEMPVSTAEVYAAWKPEDSTTIPPGTIERICQSQSADEIAGCTLNQLEPAVFRVAPKLREVFDIVSHLDVGRPRITGSGSGMFLLFDEAQSAGHAETMIRHKLGPVRTAIVPAPVGEFPVEFLQ